MNLILTSTLGALLGAIIYIFIGSKGKAPYILGDVSIIVGSFVAYNLKSVNELYLSRSLIGFGAGLLTVSGPVLLGEAWSRKRTGSVLASGGLAFNIGQVFAACFSGLTPLVSMI